MSLGIKSSDDLHFSGCVDSVDNRHHSTTIMLIVREQICPILLMARGSSLYRLAFGRGFAKSREASTGRARPMDFRYFVSDEV